MQGQRSTVDSLPETFEFDLGSASNSSIMVDPQVCWNNMLNGQNLADYLLSPDQSHVPFENAVNTHNEGLSDWNFDNPGSSGLAIGNESDLNGAKMEHNWTSVGAEPNTDPGPRLHERRSEANHLPSSENADADITNNQANTELELFHNLYADSLQSLDSDNALHSIGNVGFVSDSVRDSEADASNSFRNSHSDIKQIQSGVGSSNSHVASTDAIEHALENGDSRRLSCKRKNIGGVPGQPSFNASSSFNQNESNTVQAVNSHQNLTSNLSISSSSDNVFIANTAGSMTTRVGAAASSVASESNSSLLGENAENSQRNYRMRINSAGQHNTSLTGLQQLGNAIRNHSAWNQPLSSSLPPPTHGRSTVASMSSQMQPRLPIISGLPQYVPPILLNTPPNLRPGGSSTSVMPSDRFSALREETNMGSLLRNNYYEPQLVVPRNDLRATQDPVYWGPSSGSISSQGNMTSTSQFGTTPGSFPLISPAMVPFRNPSNQHQLSLEFIRQSISTARSNSAGQGNNTHSQRSGQSSSLHTMIPTRGVRLRGQQQQLRFSSFMDRPSNSANREASSMRMLAAGERRTRMLSEIRNVLGALRRGENLRFEDLILDHSVLLGAVDLHDRHRDMRLDVDNMSYEELLALEERIGNVSTGLSEEASLKCLKKWKYSSSTMEESSEVEPCCICQEDLIEGEEIGVLDCGHDFHTACIKQWLMHKNMCPICKTAAVAT